MVDISSDFKTSGEYDAKSFAREVAPDEDAHNVSSVYIQEHLPADDMMSGEKPFGVTQTSAQHVHGHLARDSGAEADDNKLFAPHLLENGLKGIFGTHSGAFALNGSEVTTKIGAQDVDNAPGHDALTGASDAEVEVTTPKPLGFNI